MFVIYIPYDMNMIMILYDMSNMSHESDINDSTSETFSLYDVNMIVIYNMSKKSGKFDST